MVKATYVGRRFNPKLSQTSQSITGMYLSIKGTGVINICPGCWIIIRNNLNAMVNLQWPTTWIFRILGNPVDTAISKHDYTKLIAWAERRIISEAKCQMTCILHNILNVYHACFQMTLNFVKY